MFFWIGVVVGFWIGLVLTCCLVLSGAHAERERHGEGSR